MLKKTLPLSLVVALVFAGTAASQNFVLKSSVVGSGAVAGSSDNFEMLGTVGQSAVGGGSSDNFGGSWGFWHTLSDGGVLIADLMVLLEGPYAGSGTMSAAISDAIPQAHPFGGAPWNYTGTDSVGASFFSSNPAIVDWVFVQIRATSPAPPSTMTVLAERAGFLKTDGSIVDTSGVNPLSFPTLSAGTYYVVVDHRNHLRAMSFAGIPSVSDTLAFSFTDSLEAAYTGGGAALKDLSDGKFALFTGDANQDDQVSTLDFNAWLIQAKATAVGYVDGDFNMDKQATTLDFNDWLVNTKAVAASQVPNP